MESYLNAIKNDYTNFSGSTNRKDFWMYVLFNFLFYFASTIIPTLMWSIGVRIGILFYAPTLYLLATFLPSLAIAVRRLNDIGKNGWWLLIALIPFVGAIWLIVLYCQEGSSGESASSEKGRKPKQKEAGSRKSAIELEEEYDKFNDTKTVALPESITLKQFSGSGTAFVAKAIVGSNSLDLNIKEVTIEKKKSLVLTYKHRGENWWFLRKGNIIFHCNGKNIKLNPTETDTSVQNGIEETGYYSLTKKQLEEICAADKIEIKVSGGKGYSEFSEQTTNFLHIGLRQFYCLQYDNKKYTDSLLQKTETFW